MAKKTSDRDHFYVTVHLKDGLPDGVASFPTLADARKFVPADKSRKKKTPIKQSESDDNDADKSAKSSKNTQSEFSSIFAEIGKTFTLSKSFDQLMLFMRVTALPAQVLVTFQPVLKEVGQVVEKNESREIFAVDHANVNQVTEAAAKTAAGVEAASRLPRLFLVNVISQYDVLFGKLVTAAFLVEGHAPSMFDGKQITIKEMREFQTVEEATRYLIERETEALGFMDHVEQLKKLNDYFELKLEVDNPAVKKFFEASLRRNLFIHNDGIVNTRYLSKCRQAGIDVSKTKVGQKLGVNRDYYLEAIRTTHELSVKLCQYIWRKRVPAERQKADEALNSEAYHLIQLSEYAVAEKILDFALKHTNVASEETRRRMAVNYANAIKLSGDEARAIEELDKFDWSATDRQFKIAVAAVKGDKSAVLSLMAEIGKAPEMKQNYREWPVFVPLRSDTDFQQQFRTQFGEELLVVPSGLSTVEAAKEEPNPKKKKPARRAKRPKKESKELLH